MKLGLEVFLDKHLHLFKGKRIGLVSNLTGVNRNLVPTIDLFNKNPDILLTALYGPEHGIRGDAKEGEKVAAMRDPYTELPVFSLYGKTKKPTKEMLDLVDVIVFDLQDLGSRYYTYIYTMAYVMQACGEQGIPFVVLDRPNPIGGISIEGNLVEEEMKSFVGLFPIPNRHGLTIGELALLYKYEFGIACELTVIPMEGWSRDMYFDQTGLYWVPPSPNSTGLDMAVLYPGTCLIEGTNLSEGRGTTRPFEFVGAPFIDGYRLAKSYNQREIPGVIARPVSFIPTYQKFQNIRCEGVQLHVLDRKKIYSLRAGLVLLEVVAVLFPEDFAFNDTPTDQKTVFDLLAGTKELRDKILSGKTEEFLETCETHSEMFRQQVRPYLLYE